MKIGELEELLRDVLKESPSLGDLELHVIVETGVTRFKTVPITGLVHLSRGEGLRTYFLETR